MIAWFKSLFNKSKTKLLPVYRRSVPLSTFRVASIPVLGIHNIGTCISYIDRNGYLVWTYDLTGMPLVGSMYHYNSIEPTIIPEYI